MCHESYDSCHVTNVMKVTIHPSITIAGLPIEVYLLDKKDIYSSLENESLHQIFAISFVVGDI